MLKQTITTALDLAASDLLMEKANAWNPALNGMFGVQTYKKSRMILTATTSSLFGCIEQVAGVSRPTIQYTSQDDIRTNVSERIGLRTAPPGQ